MNCLGEVEALEAMPEGSMLPVIERILRHIGEPTEPPAILPARSPPQWALGFDQDAGSDGVFVDFLGRPASVFRGTAYLAYRLGCPIIVGHIIRRADGKHHVTFEQPITADPAWDEATAVSHMTEAHVRILERVIRTAPEHYWWLHRRWKTRPALPAEDAPHSPV